jgi:hypothetical protein
MIDSALAVPWQDWRIGFQNASSQKLFDGRQHRSGSNLFSLSLLNRSMLQ